MGKRQKTTDIISAVKAKQDFELLMEEARKTNRRFVVEVQGRPMAVILGIEEWENILETLAELDDPEYLESIREARREIEMGEVVALEELAAQVSRTRRVR